MSFPYTACIARIRTAETIHGSGFLVGSRLVVTCAHVVNYALGRADIDRQQPAGGVELDFPFLGDRHPITATVKSWLPLIDRGDDHSGDIAILLLATSPPNGAERPKLVSTPLLRGRRVYTFGFPGPSGSASPDLEILGPLPSGRLEVAVTTSFGRSVERGYSGAPVFDSTGVVVGMVAATSRNVDHRRCYVIPIEDITALLDPEAPGDRAPHGETKARQFARSASARQLNSVVALSNDDDVIIASRAGIQRVSLHRATPRWELKTRWECVAATPSLATILTGTGQEVSVIDGHLGVVRDNARTRVTIACLAVSEDGSLIAAGAAVGFGGGAADVELRRADSGTELRRLRGHRSTVSAIAFSRDAQILVAAAGKEPVRIWEVATGRLIDSVRVPSIVSSVAVSRNKTILAFGIDRIVHLWAYPKKMAVGALEGHHGQITALAFSSSGRVLYSGCSEGAVRAWSTSSWKHIEQMPTRDRLASRSVTSLAAQSDGTGIAVATDDGEVRLWSAESG